MLTKKRVTITDYKYSEDGYLISEVVTVFEEDGVDPNAPRIGGLGPVQPASKFNPMIWNGTIPPFPHSPPSPGFDVRKHA